MMKQLLEHLLNKQLCVIFKDGTKRGEYMDAHPDSTWTYCIYRKIFVYFTSHLFIYKELFLLLL